MDYSIGEVSKLLGIPPSTLRYYDREGLFPNMTRSSGGIRVFKPEDIEWLKMIECLKETGMPIKDIKQFIVWCNEGDGTLQQRQAMFYERKAVVELQMENLQKTLDILHFKCWFYDTAVKAGSDSAPKNMPLEELPDDIRKLKENLFP